MPVAGTDAIDFAAVPKAARVCNCFGHIGQAVAVRAKAFGMRVHAANRSPVANPALVDRSYLLSDLPELWGSADVVVVSLPLTDETRGLVDAAAFAAMPKHAVLINVGRGAVVEEASLIAALREQPIGGAIIDTWYQYPTAGSLQAAPATLPFHDLLRVLQAGAEPKQAMADAQKQAMTRVLRK